MARRGRRGIGVALVLIAAGCCLAALAYAASRGDSDRPARGKGQAQRLPRPTISRHPTAETIGARATFAFTHRRPGVRFSCRLDRGRWQACRSPLVVTKLGVGRHSFLVRALGRRRGRSAAARFRWTRLEPRPFTIAPDLSGLGELYPGAPPVTLPLTIENPNSRPILVTDLRVSVAADPAGCSGADNLALLPSSASSSMPLKVPARGSVRLPAGRISTPAIQLRDLPVNQDACKGARFPLEFTGSAHG
jgi:hypothetical protein